MHNSFIQSCFIELKPLSVKCYLKKVTGESLMRGLFAEKRAQLRDWGYAQGVAQREALLTPKPEG